MEDILSAESTMEDEWEIEFTATLNIFDAGLREARIEEKRKSPAAG